MVPVCLCPSAASGLTGNQKKSTLCFSTVVLWLLLHPACVNSHGGLGELEAVQPTGAGAVRPLQGSDSQKSSLLKQKGSRASSGALSPSEMPGKPFWGAV